MYNWNIGYYINCSGRAKYNWHAIGLDLYMSLYFDFTDEARSAYLLQKLNEVQSLLYFDYINEVWIVIITSNVGWGIRFRIDVMVGWSVYSSWVRVQVIRIIKHDLAKWYDMYIYMGCNKWQNVKDRTNRFIQAWGSIWLWTNQ